MVCNSLPYVRIYMYMYISHKSYLNFWMSQLWSSTSIAYVPRLIHEWISYIFGWDVIIPSAQISTVVKPNETRTLISDRESISWTECNSYNK